MQITTFAIAALLLAGTDRPAADLNPCVTEPAVHKMQVNDYEMLVQTPKNWCVTGQGPLGGDTK